MSLAMGNHNLTHEFLEDFATSQLQKAKGRGTAMMTDSEIAQSFINERRGLMMPDNDTLAKFYPEGTFSVVGSPLLYNRLMVDFEQNPKGVVNQLVSMISDLNNSEEPEEKKKEK